jgi:hypothetical protein
MGSGWRTLAKLAPMAARKPKGYEGIGHVTLGSDILAVLTILRLPEQVLGTDEVSRLRAVNAADWYPIEWLLHLMDLLDKHVGHYGLIRMGRALFKMSHEERFLTVAKSARDAIFGVDAMYHFANRGKNIGGWKVCEFTPGYAVLEKNTPHHCVMEQGLLLGALAALSCPVSVAQDKCFRRGDDACIYTMSSTVTDARWTG